MIRVVSSLAWWGVLALAFTVGCGRVGYEFVEPIEHANVVREGGVSEDPPRVEDGGDPTDGGANIGSSGDAEIDAGDRPDGATDADGSTGSSGSQDGGSTDSGGTASDASVADASSGGTASDASVADAGSDGTASDASAADAGGGGGSCGITPQTTWSFDADVEGWTWLGDSGASATLSWTSAVGNPAPGSLQLNATSGNGIIGDVLYAAPSPRNLRGRTLSARVMLAQGGPASANFIAATTLTTVAFGPSITLSAGVWTCVTFVVDSPESSDAGYDPGTVRYIGLQPTGKAPFRVYIDEIAY